MINCQYAVLCQHLTHNIAMNVGQPKITALKFIGHSRVIDAQAMQDRCIEIMNVNRVLSYVVAEVVGLTD